MKQYLLLDKKFLQENPEIKSFILNENDKLHGDFTIINTQLDKSVLTIELDWQY